MDVIWICWNICSAIARFPQFWTPAITVLPIRATIPCLNQYLDLGKRKGKKDSFNEGMAGKEFP